jgi:hypothetical protein
VRRIGLAGRADTATRHKREQCCYSFMHIFICCCFCLARESVSLIDWPCLTSFSGNGRAKFSKKLQKSGPQISRPVRQRVALRWGNNRGQDVRQSHRSAQWTDWSYSVANRDPGDSASGR